MARHSKVLEKWADKHADIVDQYFADQDGHWIWLKSGYYFANTECGTGRGDTVTEALNDIRGGVYQGTIINGFTEQSHDDKQVA